MWSQFGRAMHELDIEIICANTPQAKGRVERAIQTLQDRLPKGAAFCAASRRGKQVMRICQNLSRTSISVSPSPTQ